MGINALVVQPSLASYRVPLYRALNKRPNIHVEVAHPESVTIPSAHPVGFTRKRIESYGMSVLGRRITATPYLLRTSSTRQPDVVVLSWNANETLLLPALLRLRRKGIGTVLWGHGYSLRETAWRSAVRRRIATLADAILVYDEETAKHLRRHRPFPRVFAAQNTIDIAPMERESSRWDEQGRLDSFRSDNGIADSHVLLHLGRLIPERHLPVLLEATALLISSGHRVTTVIIGSGPERRSLRMQARQLGISGSVRLLDGTYKEEELAPWFLSATAFVSPSHLGLGVFHAFAYGLPVVTGDNLEVHPPEARALHHLVNGATFAHDDPHALAAAIANLLSKTALRSRMAIEALKTVNEQYTIDLMVDGFENAIRYAADRRTALG